MIKLNYKAQAWLLICSLSVIGCQHVNLQENDLVTNNQAVSSISSVGTSKNGSHKNSVALSSASSQQSLTNFDKYISTEFGFSIEYPNTSFDTSSKLLYQVVPREFKKGVIFEFLPQRYTFLWVTVANTVSGTGEILDIIKRDIHPSCELRIGKYSPGHNGTEIRAASTLDPIYGYCSPITGWWNEEKRIFVYWKTGQESVYTSEEGKMLEGEMEESFRFLD